MHAPALALLAVACLATRASAGGSERTEGCIVCHGAQARQFERSVHAGSGVTCATCHGGDPVPLEKDLAHAGGVRSLKDAHSAVDECARCHSDLEQMRGHGLRTDQASLYWTSPHGSLLAADRTAQVATCTTCHGAHDIFRASDPRSPTHAPNQPDTCGRCHADAALMEPYGLAATVVDEYRRSIHGRALLEQGHRSSPSCTDCHGSHGATPPRVTEVGRVCGHCHSVVQGFFEDGPHMEAAREGAMEECISCHSSHAVHRTSTEMLTGRGPGRCSTCHSAEDEPARLGAAYGDIGNRLRQAE